MRRRRAAGLAAAAARTVHLVSLVADSIAGAELPDSVALVGGGGAYLATFALAATSNDAAERRLGFVRLLDETLGVLAMRIAVWHRRRAKRSG